MNNLGRRIPRVMSTQHPDNVSIPFFAETSDMSGEDEIQEAYYAFSHLGCCEQMWDSEGKEVDNYVVKKLLTKYSHFFKQKRLGREVFLTLRVPNPSVEKDEAKILLETLESIPRSMDVAKIFYGDESFPPVFEIILPLTTNAAELNRIYYFYKNFLIERQHKQIFDGDITLAEWIGKFLPESINVIPLFEDIESMLRCDEIVSEFIKDKDFTYQRVFLARSDPAMNYGLISAILANKIALKKLERLSKEKEIEIYPILGAGCPPFRGNLTPYTVDKVLSEYSSVETFTVQSAFKFDNPVEDVIEAIKKLKNFTRYPLKDFDENFALSIIEKTSKEYKNVVETIAPLINEISLFVPKRRMRKLHAGLFGYSRSVGKVRLPRVIAFCCSCYSIGLPPELIGLNALSEEEIKGIKEAYRNIALDLSIAMQYFNPKCLDILPKESKKALLSSIEVVNALNLSYEPNLNHREITSQIIKIIKDGLQKPLNELIIEAAHIRKFLG
ncbi:MAG: phosphoenolpyruvate carboxylase [Thermodesulfovibrio sp.]|nr:phosphoenolpyruvate carboxylase [Thermodesulfovibrio sp.]MCX7724468.1 phosphoenolpyruvate carboxylase [Thermodesulfovibrio sp.]MDW7971663.1 phosphoenolpyruvate carboxylase [Thermodesulfovibrio sp.]